MEELIQRIVAATGIDENVAISRADGPPTLAPEPARPKKGKFRGEHDGPKARAPMPRPPHGDKPARAKPPKKDRKAPR